MAIGRRLKLTKGMRSLIRHLHPDLKRKVRAALKEILANPGSGKNLKNQLSGLRSFRIGKLRIIYRLASGAVEVIALGPRRNIYAETLRLLERETP